MEFVPLRHGKVAVCLTPGTLNCIPATMVTVAEYHILGGAGECGVPGRFNWCSAMDSRNWTCTSLGGRCYCSLFAAYAMLPFWYGTSGDRMYGIWRTVRNSFNSDSRLPNSRHPELHSCDDGHCCRVPHFGKRGGECGMPGRIGAFKGFGYRSNWEWPILPSERPGVFT